MNENNVRVSCDVSIGLILTLVLIVAKVWGGAPISWLFCFAPLLIICGIALILVFIILIVIWMRYRNYFL